MFCKYRYVPFFFLFVRNLTGLLYCSAVAIALSGRSRPAVLVAHCDGRVAPCVPWSRESSISSSVHIVTLIVVYAALQAPQDASPMGSRVPVSPYYTCFP
jgi:hypothetical protein